MQALYYNYRYGSVGGGRSLKAVKNEIARLTRGNKMRKHTKPNKDKDSVAEIFFKGVDASNAVIAARTLAWACGLDKEAPTDFITRNIKNRKKKTDKHTEEFGIMITEYLRLCGVSKERLHGLVEQVWLLPEKNKRNMEDENKPVVDEVVADEAAADAATDEAAADEQPTA